MRKSWLVAYALVFGLIAGCAERYAAPVTEGRDLRLSILHTTDIHSRLLPYDMQVLAGDSKLGLKQENGPFGGIARVAHVIKRERARAGRSIHVDSGDCFQGAPIFNAFLGEIEQRAMSLLRPDAVVIGNHEFDEGIKNYATQLKRWATYPVVAANYLFEPDEPLGKIAKPVEIVNADGMKIGIIGVANFSSISSITDIGNSLNLVPMEIHTVVQDWIDILRPHVDLIVAVSHAGLGEDEELIQATEGLDIIMGGHLHIVLNPPKVVKDKSGRDVILAHSGAFAKFVGRLDVVVRDGDVVAHDYQVFPVDSTIPQDAEMVELVEPYRAKLHQLIDLDSVYGFATKMIRRFDFAGGDSPLGNLVAEGIRQYARADFAITNSLGIRTDITPGAITLDQLYNVFPFNNYVTSMYLSGADVQSLLDFATRRAAGRGCITQIQVSGVEFVMDCRGPFEGCEPECPPRATDVFFRDCTGEVEQTPVLCSATSECGEGEECCAEGALRAGTCTGAGRCEDPCTRVPLDLTSVYEMATNDYIARGGSGFSVLKVNNTQVVTDVALRDAVLETVIRSPVCVEECRDPEHGNFVLEGCTGYARCVEDLTAFYTRRRCHRVGETTTGETERVSECAIDLGSGCDAATECMTLGDCTDATCQSCTSSDECSDSETCMEGWCRFNRIACSDNLCQRLCDSDADCPGASAVAGTGQALCIGGRCQPRQGSACERDTDCLNVDESCSGGDCTACTSASDCAEGTQCLRGACVVLPASCVDYRCRVRCEGDSECFSGEACREGVCVPQVCDADIDRESACEAWAHWRAMSRCLAVPCPEAEGDGRIERILPANLSDIPLADDIDDDQ
ncbi:MAG: bifunctional metallophosphatase/5'-nucleotidase [Myxococcota bacterium]